MNYSGETQHGNDTRPNDGEDEGACGQPTDASLAPQNDSAEPTKEVVDVAQGN